MTNKTLKKENRWEYVGIIVGVISILAGLVFLIGFKDTHFLNGFASAVPKQSYGGDFYTGSQNATAYAANGVAELYKIVSACFGTFFIILGGIDICFWGSKIKDAPTNNNQDEI